MNLPTSSSNGRFWPTALSVFKKITIAVAVGLTANYVYKVLDIESWEKFSEKAEAVNNVMLDNALVLNPLYFLPKGWDRLKTNRYSLEIRSWKAPFNLTQACNDRVFTYAAPSYGVQNYSSQLDSQLNKYRPFQDQLRTRVYNGPPLPFDCQLDKVSHRFWEYPLALPDVILSIAQGIWGTLPAKTIVKFGKEYPVNVPLSAQIAPWVRRTLLLLGLFISVIFALQTPARDSNKSGIFLIDLFHYAFETLFYISIGSLVYTGLMNLILWIGDQSNQITATMGGLGTAGVILKAYFDEAKALIMDSTKEKIGEHITGRSTKSKPDTLG